MLSERELNKALRFHRDKDRSLYVAAHSMLRLILSGYTGLQPEKIILTEEPGRKPVLSDGMPSISFNLSHTEGCIAIAISRSKHIGIDVEKKQAFVEWQSIAHYYFSPAEQKALQHTPADVALFYTFWTRKEAFLKATGLGLIDDLPHIDTSSLTNNFRLEDNRLENDIPTTMHINTYPVAPDFCLSLAVPESINRISAYYWNLSDTK
jgi:4'-phosphopantetheinyl transferase